MLKKLVLILGLNCFIDVLHSMEELAENLGNNTLGEKISCNLSQLEEAWLKEDRIAVRNLTYFENFIDEENRLNLCGYFENLKQLGICPSLWYNYLMLIADDCIIHEKDIVVLHNLVEQLISNPIDSAEIFKNMLFLIRRFSPEALNTPNQGSNLLNYIVTILKKLDQKLNLLPKRRLKYIAAELLKNGANPSALDTTDIIFNQTEFYKEYQKRFEKCQKKYALKKAILEAYFNGKVDEVETLTCFSQFILDEDRIDLDGYLRKLDKLNIQHSVYDDICYKRGINYKDKEGRRYLHNLVRKWIENGYPEKSFLFLCGYIDKFSVQELNKQEEPLGSVLDLALELLRESQSSNLNIMLKSYIRFLWLKGVGLETISKDNRHYLSLNGEQFLLKARATLKNKREVRALNNDKKLTGISSLGFDKETKNQPKIPKNKSFFRKYGKQAILLSVTGIAICYISSGILLSKNKVSLSPLY